MQMKFFKENNRWPEAGDEAYEYDTRFFSPKQTKKDVQALQVIVDQLIDQGKKIPVTIPSRLPLPPSKLLSACSDDMPFKL